VRQVPLIIEPDEDDPGSATVLVDATIAGRPYRLILDTGAARTQLYADEYTSARPMAGEDTSAGSFGGQATRPTVTVTDLVIGPLRITELDVARAEPESAQVLGMDVLGRYCCHFRLDAGVMDLEGPPGVRAENEIVSDRRGHVYVDVRWPGVSGQACWDTGAGATLVDRGFWRCHPELFERVGTSVGTDVNGDRLETPLLLMAAPVIGQRRFSGHNAVAVDLSGVNRTAGRPMDLILGFPTIRQADWLFDFPAGRWTLTGLRYGASHPVRCGKAQAIMPGHRRGSMWILVPGPGSSRPASASAARSRPTTTAARSPGMTRPSA
jgi:predicted aspartyl protease